MCKLTHLVSIVFGSQSLGRKVLACPWRGNPSQDQRSRSSIHVVCPGYRPAHSIPAHSILGGKPCSCEGHRVCVSRFMGVVGLWVCVCVCCTTADLLWFPCRLKAAQGSKTITSLLALKCQRRILLTGTPVQNNLDEFFGKLDVIQSSSFWHVCMHDCGLIVTSRHT